jgi:tRNA pseudouridine13 synthase
VSPLEQELGMQVYVTKSLGVAGNIREEVDDFRVEEVLVDGSKAHIESPATAKVLGSTSEKQRFLLCILIKRNWDTFIAIKNVAIALGIDQCRIQIAGIKDAKAVTAQHITIDSGIMEDAANVNVRDIKVIPIGYVREALSTYYLLGNHFTVNIKNIKLKKATAKNRINRTNNELEALGGMPNFYGHQRFGTTRPITHLVGKAIVLGNFEEAAMLFLAKPSPHEHPASRQARQQLKETRDFPQAMMNFPKQLRFERLMLSHLFDCPGDFVGAFHRLPVKLQDLFVQAHQSYLFNRFLSERLNRGLFLDRAEVGDYVVAVERNGLPLNNVAKMVTDKSVSAVNEQVKAGRTRIALPIVGMRQKLSQGIMGEFEAEILEQEGISLEDLRVNELPQICGKGGLRAVLAPFRDFTLQNISNAGGESQVQLSFTLLRGCYATVLLRELMKPSDPRTEGF